MPSIGFRYFISVIVTCGCYLYICTWTQPVSSQLVQSGLWKTSWILITDANLKSENDRQHQIHLSESREARNL